MNRMLHKLKEQLKGSFVRNVMMLTGGTAFAQILNIVLSPVITRLYTPGEYGILSVYGTILLAISIIGSMNFEMGIPIAKTDRDAINVFTLSLLILLFSTVLIVGVIFLWGDWLLTKLNASEIADYKYLLPIGFFFIGVYNIFMQWNYREKAFKAITKTKFTQSFAQNTVNIILGVANKGPIGLLLGRILGQSAGLSTLSYPLIRENSRLFREVKASKLVWAFKKYRNFLIYTTPRRYIGNITTAMPVLFLASIYDSKVVGFFGLANSVIQLPMNLIGTSISNVFYAESASLRHTEPKRVKVLSNKLLKVLLLIGIIPMVVLILFGDILFSIVFGAKWAEAGLYASLLSVSVFARFVFKPISNIFDIYERQKAAFLLNIFRLILVLFVFASSVYLDLNPYWTVGLYSVSVGFMFFIQYVLAQKILNDEVLANEE